MELESEQEEFRNERVRLIKKNPHLRKQYTRWILLLLLTIIEALNVVGSDYPAPLQSYLLGSDQNLTSLEYNSLVSISYIGTAITCFSGGYLTNLYGPDKVMYLITSSHCIGLFLFTLGHYVELLPIMLIGRFFNGIGEGNFICYSLLIDTWFKNLELSVSFSILLNGGRLLAYGLTYSLTIIRVSSGELMIALFAAFAMALLSLILTIILNLLSDKFILPNSYTESQIEDELILESTSFSKYAKKQYEYFKLINKDVYIISVAIALALMTLLLFSMNYNDIFKRVFFVNPQDSAFAFFLSVVGGLPFGYFCSLFFDKYGYRLYFLLFGVSSVIIIHMLVAYLEQPDISFIIWILFPVTFTAWSSAFWPIIISLLPKYLVSTAPGIYYIVNFGSNSVVSLLYGLIKDQTNDNRAGYFWASHFTLLFTGTAMVLLVISCVRNIKLKLKLNHPNFGKS